MNRSRWISGALALCGLALAASGALAGPPAPPSDSTGTLPDTNFYAGIHWRVLPEQPCAAESVAVAFDFCTCNVTLLAATSPGGDLDTGVVNLHVRINDHVCVQCGPDTVVVPIGKFMAGSYMVDIVITATFERGDSTGTTVVTHHPLYFFVSPTCTGPPPGPLPYVGAIRIGTPSPCPECPPTACPGDSIPVVVVGAFPDNCIQLRGIELLPSPVVGPMPEPPIVRIVYEVNSCLERPCTVGPFRWMASVNLPPLPPRGYELPVQTAQLDLCNDSLAVTGAAVFPFTVVDSCGPPPPPSDCFTGEFEGTTPGDTCAAFVSPGAPAVMSFDVASSVALAGLQGKFALYPPGLAVTRMVSVGPASGMHLVWKPTDEGASFVLFADSGAPIPDTNNQYAVPVLKVSVAAVPGVPIPERTGIYPTELLASDVNGVAVPGCPTILETSAVLRRAMICAGAPCDLNGDGASDVRDLVVMVHCILGGGDCPPGRSVDCNHDGANTIDDVLCCARIMLGGEAPPDTTAGRAEPGVTVRLSAPVRTPTGVDLPLTLTGAERVGAARLELAFPAGRFDVAGVDLGGDGSGWLNLHETNADRLVIGLIGLPGSQTLDGSSVDLVVHFVLKPGQAAGGEVTLAATQFSGPDGVALKTAVGQPSRTLGPQPRVALTASRPNPFASETRFSVQLAAAGDLDVSVYDLQGRLVTSLYHGHAEAGTVDLVWRRTRADGSAAPSGIYFYRAVAGGVSATGKVVVLSRE